MFYLNNPSKMFLECHKAVGSKIKTLSLSQVKSSPRLYENINLYCWAFENL